MTLTEIANKLGTDKGNEHFEAHYYTSIYETFFEKWKNEPVKFLEIGVYDPRFPGASIELWKSFFSKLSFIGFDINENSKMLESENVDIFIGDQNSIEDIKRCIDLYGGDYDIIIDDGLHKHSHHIVSFTSLIPYLKKGGIYVIEDLHAYDCQLTIEWFKENNLPHKLYCNNKLLIYEK